VKYYKTIIQVEIVHDENFDPHQGLSAVAHEMTFGDISGITNVKKSTQLSKKQCANALIKQGSDPSFLLGEEYEEE